MPTIMTGVQLQSGMEAEGSFRLLWGGVGRRRGEGLTVRSSAGQKLG